MNIKSLAIIGLALLSAVPLSAGPKKKKVAPRAMLETMESVPCGAKQRGLSGLGTIWASAGITHVNSDEKLCQQYLLRTDDMEYHVRPTDNKHPVVLPVGQEVEYKIKGDKMFVKVPDGDKKTHLQGRSHEPDQPSGQFCPSHVKILVRKTVSVFSAHSLFVFSSGGFIPPFLSLSLDFSWQGRKKFSLSLGNGPCNVAMPNHALPSRRLQHDTPHDGVRRVGPARMLFVACPIQSKPDGRDHRTK